MYDLWKFERTSSYILVFFLEIQRTSRSGSWPRAKSMDFSPKSLASCNRVNYVNIRLDLRRMTTKFEATCSVKNHFLS